jgi:hypothetical protein
MAKKRYFDYRKQIYASVNGTMGNMVKLSKSKLLKKNEKDLLIKSIESLKELSVAIKENNKSKWMNKLNLS